jgi:hypothetical protein
MQTQLTTNYHISPIRVMALGALPPAAASCLRYLQSKKRSRKDSPFIALAMAALAGEGSEECPAAH